MAGQRAFPLNAWYAIAWDAELRHELFPRTVANKKIVLY
jgi:phenylpropionate dioxygenase-like ring-hydroxylating dioxygenase large terminal subunit